MSAAACKTILCSGDARASVQSYLINTDNPASHAIELVHLRLAANAVVWELQQIVEVTHLFAEQGNEVTKEAAYPLIHIMDEVENDLADQPVAEAIDFLNSHATALHEGIRVFHLAVTGEAVNY